MNFLNTHSQVSDKPITFPVFCGYFYSTSRRANYLKTLWGAFQPFLQSLKALISIGGPSPNFSVLFSRTIV